MKFSRIAMGLVMVAGLAALPAMAGTHRHAATSGHKHVKHASAPKAKKMHGQQTIDPERATAIQQALIRQHYMNGEPTGHWDADTQAAMTKFQADQGWQTRITPDSRALIKLGLGPDHSAAINATSDSHFNTLSSSAPVEPQSLGLVAASGVSH